MTTQGNGSHPPSSDKLLYLTGWTYAFCSIIIILNSILFNLKYSLHLLILFYYVFQYLHKMYINVTLI